MIFPRKPDRTFCSRRGIRSEADSQPQTLPAARLFPILRISNHNLHVEPSTTHSSDAASLWTIMMVSTINKSSLFPTNSLLLRLCAHYYRGIMGRCVNNVMIYRQDEMLAMDQQSITSSSSTGPTPSGRKSKGKRHALLLVSPLHSKSFTFYSLDGCFLCYGLDKSVNLAALVVPALKLFLFSSLFTFCMTFWFQVHRIIISARHALVNGENFFCVLI